MTNIDAHPFTSEIARGFDGRGTHREPQDDLTETDDFSAELARLSEINAELLGHFREPAPGLAEVRDGDTDGTAILRAENAELRARVAELEQQLAAGGNEGEWADRQGEYEALLEEKSEVIRGLHLKLQEAQECERRPIGGPVPREEELVQLKAELEEQREQLRCDEESLMAQMRQMEMALSKDRAELARQRQEVQRLQAELNREIEQSSRDPLLRERLMSLRRPQEAAKKEAALPTTASEPADKNGKQNSGLFRRLFG